MESFKSGRICAIGPFSVGLMVLVAIAGNVAGGDGDLTLWYKQPATKWAEALPIGNGRLGALVFGKIADEQIILNEDTIWTGSPYEPSNPKGAAAKSVSDIISIIRIFFMYGKRNVLETASITSNTT